MWHKGQFSGPLNCQRDDAHIWKQALSSRLVDYKAVKQNKKAPVQEVHLFGRQQNMTKSVLSLNHWKYFQERKKKKKKVVDIEAHEKGT